MENKFNIIDFISGLTSFVMDKSVLNRIALERGVLDVTSYSELDKRTTDLLKADILYEAYLSPSTWASYSSSHGGFSKTIGNQTVSDKDKEKLYKTFHSIYKKYEDDKLEEVENLEGSLQWLNF